MWHSCSRRKSTPTVHPAAGAVRAEYLSASSGRSYPGPVAEGQHQRNQPWLQLSQSCQVVGGQTGHVVPCSHFTEQAAAEKAGLTRATAWKNPKFEREFIQVLTPKLGSGAQTCRLGIFLLGVRIQMLFTNSGGEESSYLQTSRQNTAGTLAWKSDSTSENSAAGRTEKH